MFISSESKRQAHVIPDVPAAERVCLKDCVDAQWHFIKQKWETVIEVLLAERLFHGGSCKALI